MHEILKKIAEIGIVPVIKIDDANDAIPLVKALSDGGLPVAEVTFRTAAAEQAIRNISEALPDVILGAGTVITTEQVDKAVAAGAKFIVSPGLNPKIVKYCTDKGIPITPGCANPSDLEQAIECGLDVVKFFPAEQAGGIKMIKAMSAPYTSMKFMPTGGIDASNLNSYLSFEKIIACGGSFMVKDELIKAKDWDKITELTKQAVDTMLGFDVAHVGVNCENEDQAKSDANTFAYAFGLTTKEGSSSIFAGSLLECMKSPYLGKNGHIAVKTNYLQRAIYHLKLRGIEFDDSTAKFDDKGKFVAIYLKGDIGGFAIHLVQKK